VSDTVSYESLVCFSNHKFSAIIIIIYFYWNVQLLKFINLINFLIRRFSQLSNPINKIIINHWENYK